MKTRVLTGLAIVAPAFYLLGWSPKWLFMAVQIAVAEFGLYEYIGISRKSGVAVFAAVLYAAGAALCLLQWAALRDSEGVELIAFVILLLLVPVIALWEAPDLKTYLGRTTSSLFGIFYAAFCLSFLFPLRFARVGAGLANGRALVYFLFVVICAGDIFAYFTGRSWGRHYLFPRVSPKKTVEGAVGGLVASVFFGWLFARFFWRPAHTAAILGLAVCVAVAGQFGDLVESALKRGAGMKDSGAVLPGHGGVLDRVDSLLFGAPVLWLALVLRNWVHL